MDRRSLLKYGKFGVVTVCMVALFVLAGIASSHYTSLMSRQRTRNLMAHQSRELERVALSNKSIDIAMHELLTAVPGATVVRVNIIHNGTNSLSQRPILFADNLFAISAPGFSPGDLQTNIPMSRFAEYLSDLDAGKCVYRVNAYDNKAPDGDRWRQLAIHASEICPLLNSDNNMMGMIFLGWHDGVGLPRQEDLPKIAEATTRTAKTIAVAFELRIDEDD